MPKAEHTNSELFFGCVLCRFHFRFLLLSGVMGWRRVDESKSFTWRWRGWYSCYEWVSSKWKKIMLVKPHLHIAKVLRCFPMKAMTTFLSERSSVHTSFTKWPVVTRTSKLEFNVMQPRKFICEVKFEYFIHEEQRNNENANAQSIIAPEYSSPLENEPFR